MNTTTGILLLQQGRRREESTDIVLHSAVLRDPRCGAPIYRARQLKHKKMTEYGKKLKYAEHGRKINTEHGQAIQCRELKRAKDPREFTRIYSFS